MTLSANFTSKSVFDQQGCRALTFALARLSCLYLSINYNKHPHFHALTIVFFSPRDAL